MIESTKTEYETVTARIEYWIYVTKYMAVNDPTDIKFGPFPTKEAARDYVTNNIKVFSTAEGWISAKISNPRISIEKELSSNYK